VFYIQLESRNFSSASNKEGEVKKKNKGNKDKKNRAKEEAEIKRRGNKGLRNQ